MHLKQISLQNFRSYTKSEFTFDKTTTVIVGPNTSGKTNILEAIYFVSTGKSFRAEKDAQAVQFDKSLARIKGLVNGTELEVVIAQGAVAGREGFLKKFLVNGVAKRRADFAGNLVVVLFSPQDLEIIIHSPGLRRDFLDGVLEQVDKEYVQATVSYAKSLRQRNALLEKTQESGVRNEKQFEYWDELLIKNGQYITKKREELINFCNSEKKDIFDFAMFYDRSEMSRARLDQYKDAEIGAGVTLVGPHRDDFRISMFDDKRSETHDVKLFASRGQQRLAILQLKLLALTFIEQALGQRPLLLLDDIFSELDEDHIRHVLDLLGKQQTILTTTHEEFIDKKHLKAMHMIELGQKQ